jgi:hypothetical protein
MISSEEEPSKPGQSLALNEALKRIAEIKHGQPARRLPPEVRRRGWIRSLATASPGHPLRSETANFIAGRWAKRAIAAGWNDGDLFSQKGLVLKLLQGWRIVEITAAVAVMRDGAMTIRFERPNTEMPAWFAELRGSA